MGDNILWLMYTHRPTKTIYLSLRLARESITENLRNWCPLTAKLLIFLLCPSPKHEGYIRFGKWFATLRRMLRKPHKIYVLLVSVKFWIDVSMSVCPSSHCHVCCNHWKLLHAGWFWKWAKSVKGHRST